MSHINVILTNDTKHVSKAETKLLPNITDHELTYADINISKSKISTM